MNNRLRRRTPGWLLILFAASLLPFALASGPQILGQIVRSQGTSLGGSPVPNEGSIVAGDAIETAKAGSALLRFGTRAEAVVAPSTRVTFSGDPGKLVASLAAGAITVEMLSAAPFVTVTANSKIEPVGPTAATYVVSFRPGQGTAVESRNGTVRVIELRSATTHLVSAGGQVLIAQSSSNPSPGIAQQEPAKPSPSLPAGPAQPVTVSPPAPAPSSASTPQESGHPAPSQPAGPSMPAAAAHSSSTGIILLVVGAAGAAGAALAASGGGHGPSSPSVP